MAGGSNGMSVRNDGRVMRENCQGNDPAGAGAKDGCGLVAHMLNQALEIIGVSLEPTIVVLRPIELAPGEAAPIIGDHGVVRRQMFRYHSETAGVASGARNHE